MNQSVILPKLTKRKQEILHSLHGCITFTINAENVVTQIDRVRLEGTLDEVLTELEESSMFLTKHLGCSNIRLTSNIDTEDVECLCMYGTRPRTPEEVQIYDQHIIEEAGKQARREILQLKLLRKKYPHI